MSEQRRDLLSIYGFSFEFPVTARLEFSPKFAREGGDLAVKSPGGVVVFTSWGDLQKVAKRLPTVEDHARYSLERVKGEAKGGQRGVVRSVVPVNGHEAIYNEVEATISKRGLLGGEGRPQMIRSMHLHCAESGRYFVLSCSAGSEDDALARESFQMIMRTFKCHGLSGSPAEGKNIELPR